jgi:hypothetical protein
MAERLKAERRRSWLAAFAATMALALLAGGAVLFRSGLLPDARASGGVVYKQGVVASRATVLGENGEPIFAEFDESGAVVNVLGEAVDELADAVAMSGENYRAVAKAYNDYRAANEEGVARGARVMTREEYGGTDFGSVDVPRPNDGGTESVRIPKPTLRPAVKSVLVRARETIIDPGLLPQDRGPILLEAPIDLREGYLQELDESIRSVLLNAQGQVIRASENNIGYRTAWVKPDDGPGDPTQDNRFFLAPGDQLWGPVSGARVEGGISNFTGYTDESGRFRLPMFIPPCPGFSFTYDYNIFARLNYRNFNPEAPRPVGFYYFSAPTYDICVGYGEVPLGLTLGALMTQISLQSQSALLNLSGSERLIKIPVDLLVFTGDATLSNDGVTPLPVMGETRYEATPPPPMPFAPQDLDLDLDRNTDWTVLQGDVVDVFLGGRYPANEAQPYVDEAGNPIEPDLQRLPDYEPDFEDRGLLRTISQQDLEETDIYVYRVSTGQLVVERQGLSANQILEQDGRFYYRILLPGPRAGYARVTRTTDVTGWQAQAGLNEELRGFQADFLRAGEQVKLIAINRPTGYIGTVTAIIESPGAGRFDFPIDRLVLRPPQLKIKAERLYTVEAGLTKGEDRRYTVGFEGTGLTTDTYVAVYSEWTDHDGTPLPEELEGYTGRLAKVTGPNTLEGGDVAFFEIKPGTQLQLVQLAGDVLGSEHFYVHVSGYPRWRNPDFSETGAGPGPLEYRPSHYVPVRVPILDEKATRALRTTARYLEEDGGEVPGEVDALYRWPYRPEMQFSMLELKVKAIAKEDLEGITSDLYAAGEESEDIPTLVSSDRSVEVLYDLFQQSFTDGTAQVDVLTPLGPQREMVFALGEDELRAAFGDEQNLTFTNLAHLGALNPEDFLSVRLYQNSDPENVLWEWAFGFLGGAPETAAISADSPSLELVAYTSGEGEVELVWQVEGPNGSLSPTRVVSPIGVLTTELHTSRRAGDAYYVKATVVRSENDQVAEGTEVRLGPFLVEPGLPATIEMQVDEDVLPADEVSTAAFTATVYDAHGNTVSDGTPVSWNLIYDGELKEQVTETLAGEVSVNYEVGDRLFPSEVIISAGAIELSKLVEKRRLSASLSPSAGSLVAGTSQTVTLTVSSDARDGTPVTWNTTRGTLLSAQETIIEGTAQAVLQAAGTAGDSMVTVSVGNATDTVVIDNLPSGALTVSYEHAAIVSAPSDGAVVIDGLAGPVSHTYISQTTATIRGTPGQSVTLTPGGFYTPNALPALHLAMNGLEVGEDGGTRVIDEISGIVAGVVGSVTADPLESFTRPGASLKFEGGHLLVTAAPELDIADDLFLNIRFRISEDGGQVAVGDGGGTVSADDQILVRKGNGTTEAWNLFLTDDATTLRASVTTDQGTYSVVASTPLVKGQWYIAGLRVRDGLLVLGLNEQRFQTNLTGTIVGAGTGLAIGAGFSGNIDDVKLGQETASSALLTFAGGSVQQGVTLGADGTASVTIRATGVNVRGGQVIGLSASSNTTTAAAERSNGLMDVVVETVSGFLGIGVAYADEVAGAQESGLAVSESESWGWVAEWVGERLFGEYFDEVKTVANFVYQLTALSDVVTLLKAVWALAKGETDDLDGFEVTFAAIGIGVTALTLFTTGGSALPAFKGGLSAIKPVLKELFKTGAREALEVGIVVAKFLFRKIKVFISDPRIVLSEMVDFAAVLKDVVLDATGRTLTYMFRTVRSLDDVLQWIKSLRLKNVCLADATTAYPMYALVGADGQVFFEKPLATAIRDAFLDVVVGREAYAIDCLGVDLYAKIRDLALDTARYGDKAGDVTKAVRKAANALEEAGIVLSNSRSIEVLGDLAARDPALVEAFARNAVNGFPAGVVRLNVTGEALDTLLDTVGKIPASTKGYDDWIRKMSGNAFDVKSLVGEGQGMEMVLRKYQGDNPRLVELFDKVDDEFENIEGTVVKPTKNMQATDGVFELEDGTAALLESKVISNATNLSEAEILKRLEKQFFKHLQTKVMPLIEAGEDGLPVFKGAKAPIIDYHLAGSWFSPERVEKIKQVFTKVLEDPRLERIAEAEPAFVFGDDNILLGQLVNSIIN